MMRAVLRALVRCYQLFFSAWINAGCRYEPSCSHYALQALDRHGAAAGSYLAARRILRCHPWCAGGFDPVPASFRAAPASTSSSSSSTSSP